MNFRLLMIGAMYENGGNTTHRFLDGHPQLFVYPFESQLGTRVPDYSQPRAKPTHTYTNRDEHPATNPDKGFTGFVPEQKRFGSCSAPGVSP